MDHQKVTTEIYNKYAREFSAYFSGKRPRKLDIERALSFLPIPPKDAVAVEIGCGDGRDALVIVPLVKGYQGFDPSSGLLAIAQERLPSTSFIEANALNYTYPENVDIFFAFASLLHIPKDDLVVVFEKMYRALSPGGVVYLSLKEADDYVAKVKEDEFGKRMFYFYNPTIISELAGARFEALYESHQQIGATRWFTMALVKVDLKGSQEIPPITPISP